MTYERLTPLDAVFLHVESPDTPTHVAMLVVLEGEPFFDEHGAFRLDEVRRRVLERLHLTPRLRKRIMSVPLEQGRPVWVDDERFDIKFHVRHTALPKPGRRDQLHALMGRLQAQMLDRRRALWELWFVEGLEGGQVAMIMKVHHCMVDGISGVDLLTVLVDPTREAPVIDVPEWKPEPAPQPGQLLFESLRERATEPAEMLRSVNAALRAPRAALRRLGQVGGVLTTAAKPFEPAPWNAEVSPHRAWAPFRISLEEVKTIRKAVGATVNDVVLAACTGALRSYLQELGEPVDGRSLRVAVPVSVRSDDERGEMGNKVAMMMVDLPAGDADPRLQLAAIQERMRDLKESEAAMAVHAMLSAQRFLPPTLLSIASRQLARSVPIHTTVTNVPGPQLPLYCMGAELLELYPYGGLAHGMGLFIALVSYNGWIGFGVTACPELMPGLPSFMGHLEKAFAELAVL